MTDRIPIGYPESAKALLSELFPEKSIVEFRLIAKGVKPKQIFVNPVSAADWEELQANNKQGYNIYFGVCSRKTKKGTKEELLAIPAFWVDLDAKDFHGSKRAAIDHLRESLPTYLDPSIIVDTGHGYHVYWLFRENEPIENEKDVSHLESYLRGLARALKGDPGSCDLTRILRLPGLFNLKFPDKPVPARIILWHPERRYAPSDFVEYYEENQPGRRADKVDEQAPPKETKLPERFNEIAIKRLLENCAFIQHCAEDARTLPEPHWWSMISILVRFGEPGRQSIHERSQPYPEYTEEETDQKIKEALKAGDKEIGPHTCLFIEQTLGFACPEDCPARGKGVKSPAGLATKLAAPAVFKRSFKWTDLGNAERLVNRHGRDIRYNEERKKWLIWNSKIWEWDFGSKIMSLAKETARNILREAADEEDDDRRKGLIKHAIHSESDAKLNAMISLARSEPGIPVQTKELDSNPWLFNCCNGTIDLRTGVLLPHNREDLITIMSPINYDPNAPCKLWLNFLNRVTDGSAELIEYLQRAVGYSLTGDTRAQALFFLYGLGNNGKSTFIATIRKMMAGYGATAPVDMFLLKDKNIGGPKEDLANLQGKRFVAASEIEVGRRLAVVMIKEMTGGEAIRADRKYEHEIEFIPTHKLWISGNHKPVIADTSLAIWRRIKLIPFTVTIPDNEIDKSLPLKLEADLSNILAWAVEGCLAWQRDGLREPPEITMATLAYRQEEDILAEYIQDCCALKTGVTIPRADLYDNYKQWCENAKCQPVSPKTLRARLIERGITEGRSGNIRYWRGIELLRGQENDARELRQQTTFLPESSTEDIPGRGFAGRPDANDAEDFEF